MVDTRPLNEGLQTLAALSPYVRCVHTPLTGAAATMREATRVILGTLATISSLNATGSVFLHLQNLIVVNDLNTFSSSQYHIRSICSPFKWIDACACGNRYGGCCCIGTTPFFMQFISTLSLHITLNGGSLNAIFVSCPVATF